MNMATKILAVLAVLSLISIIPVLGVLLFKKDMNRYAEENLIKSIFTMCGLSTMFLGLYMATGILTS